MIDPPILDRLRRIGLATEQLRELPEELPADQFLARIVEQHRNGFRLHDGADEVTAHAPATLMRRAEDPLERPAVGDFVIARRGNPVEIVTRLPRRSLLHRGAAGEDRRQQAIAANVDLVLVVCGLDHDYNPRRIERYLLLCVGSGAQALVLLTKADSCPDAAERVHELEQRIGSQALVIALNARDLACRATLAPFLGIGTTAVLVGSSGAGKSTLTNSLLGIERMRTGEVRAHDSRGRHTTTHRALIQLPDGACLIDTPGMREIKLADRPELDPALVGRIGELASACRFTDCRHGREPGCAVRAALADGSLPAEQYEHYEKLQAELAALREDPASRTRRKAEEKTLGRALNKRLIEKYGSR